MRDEPQPPRLLDPPTGRNRKLANAVIVSFTLLMLWAPATCYLFDRGSDERFCWRMFSTMRMRKCSIGVVEFQQEGAEPMPQPLNLRSEIHSAWINSLKRHRQVVVDKFLNWRCEQPNRHSVVLTRTCQEPGGGFVPADKQRIECESGTIEDMEFGR